MLLHLYFSGVRWLLHLLCYCYALCLMISRFSNDSSLDSLSQQPKFYYSWQGIWICHLCGNRISEIYWVKVISHCLPCLPLWHNVYHSLECFNHLHRELYQQIYEQDHCIDWIIRILFRKSKYCVFGIYKDCLSSLIENHLKNHPDILSFRALVDMV